jgi:hypothetical protein
MYILNRVSGERLRELTLHRENRTLACVMFVIADTLLAHLTLH